MDGKTIADALILGIVEGVTEFIPVSSTGHLLLAGEMLGFESAGKAFEVLIQLGAILALLSVYAARLWQLLTELPRNRRTQRFAAGVVIAFLPAAILGVSFHRIITEVFFESLVLICVALVVGGLALLWLDRLTLKPRYHDVMDFPLKTCLGIGLFQTLSLIPGVSRSGATIAGALLLGTDKRSAAEYSFFLAMPTMAGAFVYDLYKNFDAIDANEALIIAIGFVTAFISALVVVRSFLDFVSRHGFAPFAWWRIIVGGVGLIVLLFLFDGSPKAAGHAGSGGALGPELTGFAEPIEIGRQDRVHGARLDAEAL
ncbi:MAG TPA: undecaprenyl-diphosphate phosphatase [Hyphomicrobiales bacterium]|nr:undecaprenyl-diphosphate phosphatase [Hyphomicrobiales bacterium]